MIRASRSPTAREEEIRVKVELGDDEYQFLKALPSQLREVLLDPEHSPKVIDRLFPPAHRDAKEDAEHRALLGRSLYMERLNSLERYESSLDTAQAQLPSKGMAWNLSLDAAAVDLWLHVINDLRLLVGTEIGIEDNGWIERGPKDAEDEIRFHLLATLSAVQEILLAALMGGVGMAGTA